jgi:oligosaccharyltransferase complex subunit beta
VEHLIVFGSSTKGECPKSVSSCPIHRSLIPGRVFTAGLPAELSPQRLSTLVNSGSNILLALPPNSSDVWRDFAREFEIDMADRGSQAVDHFGFDLDADDGSHTALVLSPSHAAAPFVTPSTQHGPPVLFRGALHSIGRSPLLQPILTVPSTTYSGQPGSQLEDLRYSGHRAVAVSGFQARNNARVSVVGSLDFLTDASANSPVRTETAT